MKTPAPGELTCLMKETCVESVRRIMKAKIAVAQMDSTGDRSENLRKMKEMTAEASENGADVILFPEHADFLGKPMAQYAESDHGHVAGELSRMAADNGIYLHCGSIPESSENDRPYNTSLFFDRGGQLVAKYRKIHLFEVGMTDGPRVNESEVISAGDQIVVADTDFGRVGFTVCYDLRFPELFHALADRGAELIFIPADFTAATGKDHWEVLLRARAIENTCYIAAANQIGEKPDFASYGHSMILDPWGRILAQQEHPEGLIYADFDTDVLEKIRKQMPSLKNARPDLWQMPG